MLRLFLRLLVKGAWFRRLGDFNLLNLFVRLSKAIVSIRSLRKIAVPITIGIAIGIVGDMVLAGTILSYQDILYALAYSPASIPTATVYLPIPVPRAILITAGYLFWPVFLVCMIAYLRKPSVVNNCLFVLVTAVGFFGIVHKYWALS